MILIESIKAKKVDATVIECKFMYPEQVAYTSCGSQIPALKIKKEICKGRIFCRPDGEEVVIAMSADAHNLLGIQYEAWDTMEARHQMTIEAHRDMTYIARRSATRLFEMSLWNRLMFVFMPKKITDKICHKEPS